MSIELVHWRCPHGGRNVFREQDRCCGDQMTPASRRHSPGDAVWQNKRCRLQNQGHWISSISLTHSRLIRHSSNPDPSQFVRRRGMLEHKSEASRNMQVGTCHWEDCERWSQKLAFDVKRSSSLRKIAQVNLQTATGMLSTDFKV